MTFRHPAALIVACVALAFPAPASTRLMPVAEVRPGMTGVGRTVFQGTTIEEFQAVILGVVRSTIGPQRDLIIARLSGGPLAKTGVIAGMSGSPVYIDNRLIGAVSYALGSFATEPIAGITPIDEMIEATTRGAGAAGAGIAPIPIGSDIGALSSAFADALRPARAFVPLAWPAGAEAAGIATAAAFRPIALPLTVAGPKPVNADAVGSTLASFGDTSFVLAPTLPSSSQGAPSQAGPLRPGDPVGVGLITGDLQFGATGTVTDVDGSRVLAFGHPLYNVGPAAFAMTRAYVHALLPSLNTSMKLASIGDVVGTLQQDRSTAVAGTLGVPPRMISMRVSLTRDGAPARRFAFTVADHPLLTPLLAYTALVGIISEHERDLGPATYALRGRATFAGHAPVEFDDVYAGDQPGLAAASAIAMPVASLLTNGLAPVRLEAIDVDLSGAERIRSAAIDRVWLDTTDIRPGRTVPVKILITPWRGEPTVHTVDVAIPLNAEGPLTLVVADGVRFGQWEQREQRASLKPASVDQMIKLLNSTRRGHRIYVRLAGRDTGAVVAGEAMPSLPSSVLAVVQGDRGAAAGPALQSSTLGTWEVAAGQAVEGLRTLTLQVANRRP